MKVAMVCPALTLKEATTLAPAPPDAELAVLPRATGVPPPPPAPPP